MTTYGDDAIRSFEEIVRSAKLAEASALPHVAAGGRAVIAMLPALTEFLAQEEDTKPHIIACGLARCFGVLIGHFVFVAANDESRKEALDEALASLEKFARAYLTGNMEYLDSGIPH